MTIHDIKNKHLGDPYFFDESTMKFFGQTLNDFEVTIEEDGRYRVYAPIKDRDGKKMGQTLRYYNPITKILERE